MKDKIFSYRKVGNGWEVVHKGQVLGTVCKSRDYSGPCWIALNAAGERPGAAYQTWATREDASIALLPKRDWSWAYKYRFT